MSRVARFGVFEADLSARDLRKQGRLVRLQQQPFELLKALLAHPNEVVTREDLRRQLWTADVVVDFDQSLNKSVKKLRDALGDSASSPRFVETIHKRGYRFVAPVIFIESDRPAETAAAPRQEPVEPVEPGETAAPVPWHPRTVLPVAVLAGLVLALIYYTGTIFRAEGPVTRPAQVATGTEDAAARAAYARGRIALSRRSEDGLRSGIELFERALALDPAYAAAYVGLADASSLLVSYGIEEPRDAMARAREFANRALTINPESSEAHASLGRTAMLADWDWKVAEWHFLRAIESEQNSPTAHQWYAYLLSATGRHAAAEREALKAASLDPLSLIAATSVGYVLYAARRFDDAAAALRRVIEVDPDFMQARKNLGLVLAAQGRYAEAIPEFERVVRLSAESAVAQADLAWALGLTGDVTGARRLLGRLQEKNAKGYVPLDSMALALAGAGQMDQALATLDAAFTSRVAGLARLAVDPRWDALREVPHVRAMADTIRTGAIR